MATRCCWPPERFGALALAALEPEAGEELARLLVGLAA